MDNALLFTLFNYAVIHPWVAESARIISDVGIYIIPCSMVFFLVRQDSKTFVIRTLQIGALIGLAVLASEYILKDVFSIVRPFITLGYTPLAEATHFSFPSTHATFAGASIVAWFLLGERRAVSLSIIGIGGLLIAISRVFLGVHYPSDVLAGLVFGALFAFTVRKIVQSH